MKAQTFLGGSLGLALVLLVSLGRGDGAQKAVASPILAGSKGAANEITAALPPDLCTVPEPPNRVFGEVPAGEIAIWTFKLQNCGDGILRWTITADMDWIVVAPNRGTTALPEPTTITVSVDTAGLTPEQTYTGHITINSNGGSLAGKIVVKVGQPSIPPEDVNQDGVIDTDDLAIVVANFGPPPFDQPRADLNGDGVADILDLARVAEAFRRD